MTRVGVGPTGHAGQDGQREFVIDVHLLAVIDVAKDAATGLHFGDARQCGGVLVGAGAAAAHDANLEPRRPAQIGRARQQRDRAFDLTLLYVWIADADSLGLPAKQAREPQTSAAVDQSSELERRLARFGARPVHADVDFDYHPRATAARNRGEVEIAHVARVVDGDDDVGQLEEAHQPLDLGAADNLVRDQDVADAARGHDLGFAELGAGDAERAGRQQLVRQRRNLDGLGVRAPADTRLAARGGHARDVALHDIQVQQQRRRVEVGLVTADHALIRLRGGRARVARWCACHARPPVCH